MDKRLLYLGMTMTCLILMIFYFSIKVCCPTCPTCFTCPSCFTCSKKKTNKIEVMPRTDVDVSEEWLSIP